MVEQHYDEEILASYADEPVELMASDKHLASCRLCSDTLRSFRATSSVLARPAVWDKPLPAQPPAASIARLRALSAQIRDEDAAAEQRVKQLLASGRETWSAILRQHPEWQNAALVRKLIAATDRFNYTAPEDAVELTRCIVEVAEGIEISSGGHIDALREHAYALGFVGRAREAMKTIAMAESLFDGATDTDRGRVLLVKAMVEAYVEDYDAALYSVRHAAARFGVAGEQTRLTLARLYEGSVLASSGRYQEALTVFGEIPRHSLDSRTLAVLMLNEAGCYRRINSFSNSEHAFLGCIQLCDAAQMPALRLRANWSLARLLLATAHAERALTLLQSLFEEFRESGMKRDAAAVALDVTEVLLALDRSEEAAGFCQSALDYFAAEQLMQTTPALTALAFIREAATQRKATRDTVQQARARWIEPRREFELLRAFVD